jgi:hypothetical protein
MSPRLPSTISQERMMWPVKAAVVGVIALRLVEELLQSRRKVRRSVSGFVSEVEHRQVDVLLESGFAQVLRWMLRPRSA